MYLKINPKIYAHRYHPMNSFLGYKDDALTERLVCTAWPPLGQALKGGSMAQREMSMYNMSETLQIIFFWTSREK